MNAVAADFAPLGQILATVDTPTSSGDPTSIPANAQLGIRLLPYGTSPKDTAVRVELVLAPLHAAPEALLERIPFPPSPFALVDEQTAAGTNWGVLAWMLGKSRRGQTPLLARPMARQAIIEFAQARRCFDPAGRILSVENIPISDVLTWQPIEPSLQVMRQRDIQGARWLDEDNGILYSHADARLLILPVSRAKIAEFERLPALSDRDVAAFNKAILSVSPDKRPPAAATVQELPVHVVEGPWQVRMHVSFGRYKDTGREYARIRIIAGTLHEGRFLDASAGQHEWALKEDHWDRIGPTQGTYEALGFNLARRGFEMDKDARWGADRAKPEDLTNLLVSAQVAVRNVLGEAAVSISGISDPPIIERLEELFAPRVSFTLERFDHRSPNHRFRVSVTAGDMELDWQRLDYRVPYYGDPPPILLPMPGDPAGVAAEVIRVGDGKWIRVHPSAWKKARSDLREIDGFLAGRSHDGRVSRAELYGMVTNGSLLPAVEEAAKREIEGIAEACLAAQARQVSINVPGMTVPLKPAQTHAVSWLLELHAQGVGGLLADDRGFGKTVEVLATIAHLMHARRKAKKAPVIVVMEAKELDHWETHVRNLTPGLSYCRYHGNHRPNYKELIATNVILTTYDIFKNSIISFVELAPEMVFLDEATAIRDHSSMRYRAIRAIVNRVPVVPITGTPLGRNITGLWAVMDIAMPGLLGSAASFSRFADALSDEGRAADPCEGPSQEFAAGLRERIKPFMFRRLKKDYPDNFPEKMPRIQYVELSAEDQELYEGRRRAIVEHIAAEASRRKLKASLFHTYGSLNRLRRFQSLPTWSDGVLNSKGQHLVGMTRDLVKAGHKVLIFTHFNDTARAIHHELSVRGIGAEAYVGELRQRGRALNAFRAGKAGVLVIPPIGKSGLDIPEADTVIINDPWVDPSVIDQMMDRAHRLVSQHLVVTCHQLVAAGTIEQAAMAVLGRFRHASDVLLDGAGGIAAPLKLTAADVEAMLSASPCKKEACEVV